MLPFTVEPRFVGVNIFGGGSRRDSLILVVPAPAVPEEPQPAVSEPSTPAQSGPGTPAQQVRVMFLVCVRVVCMCACRCFWCRRVPSFALRILQGAQWHSKGAHTKHISAEQGLAHLKPVLERALALLGKRAYVDWPFLREGEVVGISCAYATFNLAVPPPQDQQSESSAPSGPAHPSPLQPQPTQPSGQTFVMQNVKVQLHTDSDRATWSKEAAFLKVSVCVHAACLCVVCVCVILCSVILCSKLISFLNSIFSGEVPHSPRRGSRRRGRASARARAGGHGGAHGWRTHKTVRANPALTTLPRPLSSRVPFCLFVASRFHIESVSHCLASPQLLSSRGDVSHARGHHLPPRA